MILTQAWYGSSDLSIHVKARAFAVGTFVITAVEPQNFIQNQNAPTEAVRHTSHFLSFSLRQHEKICKTPRFLRTYLAITVGIIGKEYHAHGQMSAPAEPSQDASGNVVLHGQPEEPCSLWEQRCIKTWEWSLSCRL